jgi:hypothetical protein
MIEFTIDWRPGRSIKMLGAKVPALTKGVLNSVTRASIRLMRYVKEHKLSGQVLHVRTGTLRRKVNTASPKRRRRSLGQVGVKLSYARAHEMGPWTSRRP